jgi:hypothetical protein
MSVQWNQTPYFYPIQIAQFALQHYSCIVEEKCIYLCQLIIVFLEMY